MFRGVGSSLQKVGMLGVGAVGAEVVGRQIDGFVGGTGMIPDMAKPFATSALVFTIGHAGRRMLGQNIADGAKLVALLHLAGSFLPNLDVDYGGY